MSKEYWEDRLVKEGKHEAAIAALETFRNGKNTRNNQDILYEALTNLGVLSEEADEIVDLEAYNHE